METLTFHSSQVHDGSLAASIDNSYEAIEPQEYPRKRFETFENKRSRNMLKLHSEDESTCNDQPAVLRCKRGQKCTIRAHQSIAEHEHCVTLLWTRHSLSFTWLRFFY